MSSNIGIVSAKGVRKQRNEHNVLKRQHTQHQL